MVLAYALLGLVTGAFLNLAADHLPHRHSMLNPSRCLYCQAEQRWVDSVSLLSFMLGGRSCPSCGAPYSWRRPVLEALTTLTFAFYWLRYGPSLELALTTLYTCTLFLIFVIDLEHHLILRVVIFPAIVMAIVGSLFYPGLGVRRAVLGGALFFSFFYLVAVIGSLIFRRPAMGRGDANLAAFIGLITGFPEVIFALIISVCLGGLVSMILVVSRTKGLQSYIPYGVFLVVGGLAMLVFGQEIIAWFVGLV